MTHTFNVSLNYFLLFFIFNSLITDGSERCPYDVTILRNYFFNKKMEFHFNAIQTFVIKSPVTSCKTYLKLGLTYKIPRQKFRGYPY